MPSLFQGYEYDIFISYRHNDNLDGWVTELVQNLEKELKSTLKEQVTIYFDKNQHGGLLEIHNVDKSLEGKLKCLIFIPIISQTYCDPKSFAWKNEFCAFNKTAKEDQLGRDIKLSNGNVSSRILPVKIHDLDVEDKSIIENEIGGTLRGVEFIFKSPGVNRPLRANEDHPNDNQNKTFYRDQINKVANAVKEMVSSLRKGDNQIQKNPTIQSSTAISITKRSKKIGAMFGITFVIALVLYFNLTPEETNTTGNVDKSIAVLPFVNMSGDPQQEFFSDGISEELMNALTRIPGLKVSGRTSSFSYKGTKANLQEIGKQLGVGTILEGSVRKSGNTVRITAQLINVNDGFHLWSNTYDRDLTDVFVIQDEITHAIVKALSIYLSEGHGPSMITTNLEAYESYLRARQLLSKRGNSLIEARRLFEEVIRLDPNFSPAFSGLSKTFALSPVYGLLDSEDKWKLSKQAAARCLEIDPDNAEAYMVMGFISAVHDWNFPAAKDVLEKSLQLAPNDAEVFNFLGDYYLIVGDKKLCLATESKAVELDPLLEINHENLIRAYVTFGEWEKALQAAEAAKAVGFTDAAFEGDLVRCYLALKQPDRAQALAPGDEIPRLANNILMAIERGDKNAALDSMKLYSEKGGRNAGIIEFYLTMKMWDAAAQWIERAYQERAVALVYYSLIMLPEDYPDHPALKKAFDKPELKALFEIRRQNLARSNKE